MKKGKILPVMAWKGILRNGNVYFPYLIAGIFSVFTYFVFTSILHNDIIKVLPRSGYAWMMLYMGKGILSLILILFLVYANSFLVKRRQKEFGLYHILGLEKKHIGIMLFFETFLLYAGAVAGGVLFGMVLSKLLFLMLLRMCNLSVDVRFVFYPAAFRETIVYFLWVFGVNFAVGLLQVGKARPIELMSGSKKGEKEPRFLPVYALAGMAALVFGYYCSVTSKLDSMIFLNFVLAVSLVIVGTYLLFASGSIAFLKWMKGRKKFYYKPGNFVTISGMLYRMKKNAAGLSNICIFSTMVIITLICTVSLHLGMDSLVHFVHPYDMTVLYGEEKAAEEEVAQEIAALEEKYGLAAKRVDIYDRMRLAVRKEGDRFVMRQDNGGFSDRAEDYKLEIITTPEYERIENRPADLQDNEVLLHCSGRDYGYDSVDFMGVKLQVKEELTSFFPYPKAADNAFGACYVMVVKDRQVQEQCVRAWAEANGVTDMEAFLESDYRFIGIVLAGEDAQKNAFLGEFAQWCQSRPGFFDLTDNVEGRRDLRTMYGALLFLGILFGLIFFMCLILIMYYKQITEGYEDRNSFDIMQKVGMSDREIRGTVRRQILMVFGLPLAGAVMHTAAGMVMVKGLMGAVSFFRVDLLFWCTVGVIVIFMAVYGISYMMTAKTYYRIVRHE
jgi:putative ABC transport system permease protein